MQSSCILKFGNITIVVMVDSSLSILFSVYLYDVFLFFNPIYMTLTLLLSEVAGSSCESQ